MPCETNLRQQCQPDEEKNWERQFLALLTPALMGDPFLYLVNESIRFASLLLVRQFAELDEI